MDGRFPRLFKALTKAQLPILDDWGPDRLNASQRRDLMEIVADRYRSGSTLITRQLPVSTWHDVIGEPTFADAILDRLVHNAYRLELEGSPFARRQRGRVTHRALNDNEPLKPQASSLKPQDGAPHVARIARLRGRMSSQ